jgi:hypothetical protein
MALERCFAAVIVVASIFLIAGCSRGPAAVHVPEVDPAEASMLAMETFDTDHDGSLSEAELVACPGVMSHLSLYDKDGNRAVSQQEIQEQLSQMLASKVGVTSLRVQVRMDGRPLEGAYVKMVPEKYLGEDVKLAEGITNERGTATMDIRDSNSSASEQGLLGVHYGTYKVEVTHPNVQIPARYNTQTTLGYETEKGNPNYSVDLKSR